MLEPTVENTPLPLMDEQIRATREIAELQAYMNNLDLFIKTSQQMIFITTKLQESINLETTQKPLSDKEVRLIEQTFKAINKNDQIPKIIKEQSLKHTKLLVHLNIILGLIDNNHEFLKEHGPLKTRDSLTKATFTRPKKEIEKAETVPESYTKRYDALMEAITDEEEKLNITEKLQRIQKGDIIFDSDGNRYFVISPLDKSNNKTLYSDIDCLKFDFNNNTSNVILETRSNLDSNQKSDLSVIDKKPGNMIDISEIIKPEKTKKRNNPLALENLSVGDLILNPIANTLRLITEKTVNGLTIEKYNASNGRLEKTKSFITGFSSDELIVIKK